MAAQDERKDSASAGNAPGGRSGDLKNLTSPDNATGAVANAASALPALGSGNNSGNSEGKSEGFGLSGEDVKGSLKIHLKLDLEADIRVTARVRGDIAIGLL
ncbi:hypothetical protein GTA08_BOTSDO02984 [Botryosphaeria dothidea]|uniref:Uncharacterized protein n=1 Tax=Botryosphaeria dothidea TaxID=55169 RepID=A0A8H4N6X3_9PEZI|nr:hypothetical protein GTA08_BOTSDO02984 [Botryosphaeria dothidea]